MSKMTDKQIKKALECCIKSSDFGECFENKCPFVSENGCKVGKETLYPYVLDLINRQQSAIDVYTQENDRLKTAYIQVSMDRDEANAEIDKLKVRLRKERHQFEDLGKMYSEIKSEAIKEFAERMKGFANGDYIFVTTKLIDNLVKELVGEQK